MYTCHSAQTVGSMMVSFQGPAINACNDTKELVPGIPENGVWAHPFYDSLTSIDEGKVKTWSYVRMPRTGCS